MLKFYSKLSTSKKILFLVGTIILSFPVGAIAGLMLGLIATTFIPQCCNDTGCHSCFEFNGLKGYEGTGYLGFWGGGILGPIVYVIMLIYLIKK